MAGRVKVAGTWRSTPAVYTKVSGSWRTVTKAYIKVAGVWSVWFLAAITDSFTRSTSPGALGNTDTGNAWSILRGSWFCNTTATETATVGTSYPLAVVELGSSNMVVSADISNSTGVVVWGVDANNWWAVVGTNYNYSYYYTGVCTSCGTCTGCSSYSCAGACGNGTPDSMQCCCLDICTSETFVCDWVDAYGNCEFGHIEYNSYYCCSGYSCACGDGVADSNNCGCCSYSYTCCSNYSCQQIGVATQYQIKVLSSVNGTVTEINSTNTISYSNPRITVTTSGNTLSYTTGFSAAYSAVQTSPNTGTKPGIIKGPATNVGTQTIDNFAASPN